MLQVTVFDSKPYDQEYLQKSPLADRCQWRFHEFRLGASTASTAAGSRAVCIFVNDKADANCLKQMAALGVEMVALRCAGYNNIDLEAAKQLGLSVVRVPAYSPHAVAEHTVGLLLTLNRKIHTAYHRVRELNFSLRGLVGFDVYGKTIGIVGTGWIGRIAAEIFRGFGATVIAYDPVVNIDWAKQHQVKYVEFHELLASSDVISLHLPLTPETHHLLNATTLALTKPGAYLLNTSRGKLIDTTALIESIKSGHLGGVALDVYEEEEGIFFEDLSGQVLQDDELTQLLMYPNVLITAHQAFLTQEALSEIARVTIDNLLAFEKKQSFSKGSVLVDARSPGSIC